MAEARQEQQASLVSRIVRGGFWNLSGQGITMLVSLLATPVTIRLLGTERYGVLALINLLVGYLSFADWGMGTASTRFAATAHAVEDDKGEAAAVWGALLVSVVPVSLTVVALILLAPLLLRRGLQVPTALQPEAVLALQIAALGFLGRAAASVLNTPQLVRLKLRLNAWITAAGSVLQVGLLPLVIYWGGGLTGAATVITVVSFLVAVSHTLYSKSLLPGLFPPRLQWPLVKQLASFGSSVVLMNLAGILLVNAEKVLLTRFNSVSELAYYTVAYSLAQMLIIPMQPLTQAALPSFAGLQAAGKRDELQQLYSDILRGTLFAAPLLMWAVGLGAKQFFILWAGPAYGEHSVWPFYILLAGLYFNITTYVPYGLFVAFGRADFNVRYHLWEFLPYLLLAAWLTKSWGLNGAAFAWSLRVSVALPIYLYAIGRRYTLLSGFSWEVLSKQALAWGLLFGPLLATVKGGLPFPWSIPLNLFGLFAYISLVWLGLLSAAEKQRLQQWWTSLLRVNFG